MFARLCKFYEGLSPLDIPHMTPEQLFAYYEEIPAIMKEMTPKEIGTGRAPNPRAMGWT